MISFERLCCGQLSVVTDSYKADRRTGADSGRTVRLQHGRGQDGQGGHYPRVSAPVLLSACCLPVTSRINPHEWEEKRTHPIAAGPSPGGAARGGHGARSVFPRNQI